MSEVFPLQKLQAAMGDLGIRVYNYDQPWETAGFPLVLQIKGGLKIVLDIGDPGVLSAVDPSKLGVALISPQGKIKQKWGLASNDPTFSLDSVEFSDLWPLVEDVLIDGTAKSIFLDGRRYLVSKVVRGTRKGDLMMLVFDASEEAEALNQALLQQRSVEILRRIGKALSMHQTLPELCVLAAHEISASASLAACMIWSIDNDSDTLSLRAHVGINRQGVDTLKILEPKIKLESAAEFVANRKEPLFIPKVSRESTKTQLEASICYLRPGAVMLFPLTVGDKVIGILELIGRDDDPHFAFAKDIFSVVSEHLALAINTCLMFANAEKLASFDPLTGVANHRALQQFLLSRFSEAERTGGSLSFAMLDVDHFRAFNEEEGHDAGDAVLKRVAAAMVEAIRPYDLAARYGGEEFSIIMPGLEIEQAIEVAERVRHRIEQIEITTSSGRTRRVTASLGIAAMPQNASKPEHLVKAADQALYASKKAGRNCVTSFQGHYRENVNELAEDDRSWMEDWMSQDDRIRSSALHQMLLSDVLQTANKLQLTPQQKNILETMVLIYPTYYRVMNEGSSDEIREMEMASEFRALLPSLMTLSERFDGTGPMKMKGDRIPLLSRILSIHLAMIGGDEESLMYDKGRFDPEIMDIIARIDRAA